MANDRILTPGGKRAKASVHHVAARQRVRVARKKDNKGAGFAGSGIAALGDGWIANARWNNYGNPPLTRVVAHWTVPPAPATSSGQTVFLFNGIQSGGANGGILQPVLQWGARDSGGGDYWTVACWYVAAGSDAHHSDFCRVEPGDSIIGVMTLSDQTPSGLSYRAEFDGIAGTRIDVADVDELTWCNVTLEAYDVTQCSDYPNAAKATFDQIDVLSGGATPAVAWNAQNNVMDCGQHVEVVVDGGQAAVVDLYFGG